MILKRETKNTEIKILEINLKNQGKTYVLHADNIGNIISIETDDNEIIEYSPKN